MKVTASSLNVRSKASTSGKILGKLSRNAQIDVYEIKNGWAKIIYKNQTAYVSSEYLNSVDTSNSSGSTTTTSKKMKVTASSLNVRSKASTGGKILGKLSRNTQIDVYEIKNGWAKIIYKNQTAYVSSEYLQSITAAKESFVSDLNVAKQTNQIITVVGTGGYNVNVIFHEKDSNGKWKEIISTNGTVGSNGIGQVKEDPKRHRKVFMDLHLHLEMLIILVQALNIEK